MSENENITGTAAATEKSDGLIFRKALVKAGAISLIIILALYFSSIADKQLVINSFAYGLLCFALNSFISLRRIFIGLHRANSPAFFVSNSFFRMGLFSLMVVIALKYFSLNLLLIFIGFFLPFIFVIYEKLRELYRESKKIDKVLK